jgi:hypothetical protein
MSGVIIKWPKNGNPAINVVGRRRVLVASGRAHEQIIGVFGECWPTAQPGQVIQGRTISYQHCFPNSLGGPCFYRWIIAIALPAQDEYELKVTGIAADGSSDSDRKVFNVLHHVVTITSHNDGDNITDEADYFTPSGGITNYPLETATMTDTNANIIRASYKYSDYNDYQFWYAQFPPIPTGVYVLFVEDSAGSSSASVQGLTVD